MGGEESGMWIATPEGKRERRERESRIIFQQVYPIVTVRRRIPGLGRLSGGGVRQVMECGRI